MGDPCLVGRGLVFLEQPGEVSSILRPGEILGWFRGSGIGQKAAVPFLLIGSRGMDNSRFASRNS